jgi:hypothetical protein
MSVTTRQLDTAELEQRVKRMYEEVAFEPEHEFHFETGRPPSGSATRPELSTGSRPQRSSPSPGLEAAGFEIETLRENSAYRFVSERAATATSKYGVTSISLLARRH